MGDLVVKSLEPLKKSEIKNIFEHGRIVFDTNFLLNIYKVKQKTRDDIFKFMTEHKKQLWIPYQICWEFYNHKESIIRQMTEDAPISLKKSIDECVKKFTQDSQKYNVHPIIEVKELTNLFEQSLKPILDKIEELKTKDYGYSVKDDTIGAKLKRLYKGKVGEDLSYEELIQLYQIGAIRYEKRIAPGFGDAKQKKDADARRLYGDLIAWSQTLNMAKSEQVDVIYVTDDSAKGDWFKIKESGKKREPIDCLLEEFYDVTGGKKVLIYTQEDFFRNAKKYYDETITDSSIRNIQDVISENTNALQQIAMQTARWKELLHPFEGLTYLQDIKPINNPLSDYLGQLRKDTPISEIYRLSDIPQSGIYDMKLNDSLKGINQVYDTIKKYLEVTKNCQRTTPHPITEVINNANDSINGKEPNNEIQRN